MLVLDQNMGDVVERHVHVRICGKKLRRYEDRINRKYRKVLNIRIMRAGVSCNMMHVVTPFPPSNTDASAEVTDEQAQKAIKISVMRHGVMTKIVTNEC
mmetsp:Transcript_1745/g.4573  ORF Transcript_1745/g.4573 Transcript_1745/m.4573 type:complete len:99 (+) Transcript_1745:1138-1434(+)